jgi:hypothetical protein
VAAGWQPNATSADGPTSKNVTPRSVPFVGRRLFQASSWRKLCHMIDLAALQMVEGVLTGWLDRRERDPSHI